MLRPKYMLLLGNQPLSFILSLKGITRMHGKWYDYEPEGIDYTIKCMPTFHPSYVQRKEHMQDGEEIKTSFINDIREVAREMGL